jgi:hypothetical protein
LRYFLLASAPDASNSTPANAGRDAQRGTGHHPVKPRPTSRKALGAGSVVSVEQSSSVSFFLGACFRIN